MRVFYADGLQKVDAQRFIVGLLPMLLHIALFIFFCGLGVFLFNTDRAVFDSVIWLIVYFSLVYGMITVQPIIWPDSSYFTPLTGLVFRIFHLELALCAMVLIPASFAARITGLLEPWGQERIWHLVDRYTRLAYGGVEAAAEEAMSKISSKIDIHIFDWTIRALGDDDSLEKFFEAIPGFFNSKRVKDLERDFPETLLKTFWAALNRFMGRTSFNSVKDTAKARRVTICRDIMSVIPCPGHYMYDNLDHHFNHAPISIERLQAMARWLTHSSVDISYTARARVAKNLPRIAERGGRWIELAGDVYGLSKSYLRDTHSLGGDNVLLATVIETCCLAVRSRFHNWDVLTAFTQFEIRNTNSGLQHDFCTMWNEIVQEGRIKGPFSTPIDILHGIRHLYITLHQDTSASPTAFSLLTGDFAHVLFLPSSYPFCDISNHRPSSTISIHVANSPTVPFPTQPRDSPYNPPHQSTLGGSSGNALRLAEESDIIIGPPGISDGAAGEIGESFQTCAVTSPPSPVHTGPRFTHASPPGTVGVAQDVPTAATLSHPLGGPTQQDIVTPYAEPDIGEVLSGACTPAPTPTLASAPESTPLVLNQSLPSYGTRSASAPNLSLPTSSVVGLPTPAAPPQSRVPPLLNAEFLALSSVTVAAAPSHPTSHATRPRPRVRGLANPGSMCFANATLQLLVHSPPFWNLFRELGDLKAQRGEGDPGTGSGAMPLVDATVRFFEEFRSEAKEPLSTQQPLQQAARGKSREDEEEREEHSAVDSFEPLYMYDAMKEKRQLKHLLVRSCATLRCSDPC